MSVESDIAHGTIFTVTLPVEPNVQEVKTT